VDYSDPDATPEWTLRTLGIGTSVNHSSEVQVDGLRKRLEELAEIFNSSPFAKRENLCFIPDDFAYRLLGTSGDHANDQKKSHNILRIWRLEVILLRLGEEAMQWWGVERVLGILILLKAKQVEEYGGQEAWDSLPVDEKAGADLLIIREVGKQVFESLSLEEQEKLTRFVRTGCCMHKDLNCVKGGAKSMEGMWGRLKKTLPILLANKDNTAVLETRADPTAPTAAEKRAEEVSKRGATHATMLGGMICRNKDKKKGQQDTYTFYMEVHVGNHVPYPDVTNTLYGSHGEAAATILVYYEHFVNFMEFIRITKDRPGQTNIEKNFAAALKDVPTLTELCVLALYNVAVSRPFMQRVRRTGNILKLQTFFQKKAKFLESIIRDPTIWTRDNVCETYQTASLDGKEWEKWDKKVLLAVKNLAPKLPDLHDAIAAFVQGAHETFVERFSDEFKPGSGIDNLTEAERDELYFSSTNDANEGGLGSWRRGQARRPSETLHKFNASYLAAQNHTEKFMSFKLTEEEDELYLMRTARKRDASGLQKNLKLSQIRADQEKAAQNKQKEVIRGERQDKKTAELLETAQHLVLNNSGIDKLYNDDLNRHLDFHREFEQRFPKPDSSLAAEKVPLKSHMKAKADRVSELKKAVARNCAIDGYEEMVKKMIVELSHVREGDVSMVDDHDPYDSDDLL